MLVKSVTAALTALVTLGAPLEPPEAPLVPAPVSRAELVDLQDFASFRAVFEEHRGDVRLVALLSPTCGYCIKGYRYMRRLLEEISDPRLKMIVVWESMLSGDSRDIAVRQTRRGTDPRILYQAWDPENLTGEVWAGVMNIGSPAWDVYFLYGPDATWSPDAPTTPAYWQHQGAGGRENWLNYDELKAQIEQLLQRQAG